MLGYSVLYLIVIIVLFILLRGVNLLKINIFKISQTTEILEKILKNIDKKSRQDRKYNFT